MESKAIEKARDQRLDLVKAISISLVLLLHLQPLDILMKKPAPIYVRGANFLLDQFYLNFTSIAVPLFILTSLFLLFQKIQFSGVQYCINRCKRLTEIFVFWTAFHICFYYGITYFNSLQTNTPFPWYDPNVKIHEVILGVAPTLPIVQDSVFYFILILLILTPISYGLWVYQNHTLKNKLALFVFLTSIVYFEITNIAGLSIPYWRLDNFIIYVPVAYFLFKHSEKFSRKYLAMTVAGFFIFGLQDIYLRWTDQSIGSYSRVSVVCGAISVFIICLNLKPWKSSRVVRFLSQFSLGIFAVHKYCLFIVTLAVGWVFQKFLWPAHVLLLGLPVSASAGFIAVLTVLLTVLMVHCLNLSPLRKFIR